MNASIARWPDWQSVSWPTGLPRESSAWVAESELLKGTTHLPADVSKVDASLWEPQLASLLCIGLARYLAGERDDPWTLEPLYLRPSSAEEQWRPRSS